MSGGPRIWEEAASITVVIFSDRPIVQRPLTQTATEKMKISGTAGYTFGLRGDGTILPGWPTQQGPHLSYWTNGSMPGPSIADMDNDGVMEILWTLRDLIL